MSIAVSIAVATGLTMVIATIYGFLENYGLVGHVDAFYLTDFSGMSVKQITAFRTRLRAQGVEYVVVKNTLAQRALAGGERAGEVVALRDVAAQRPQARHLGELLDALRHRLEPECAAQPARIARHAQRVVEGLDGGRGQRQPGVDERLVAHEHHHRVRRPLPEHRARRTPVQLTPPAFRHRLSQHLQ